MSYLNPFMGPVGMIFLMYFGAFTIWQDSWLRPDFLQALSGWRETGDPTTIDVALLPGVRLEGPGIVSFDCLTHEFCDMLLEEVKHHRDSGFPQRPPNSMNNYGLVINEVGMQGSCTALLMKHMRGVGARQSEGFARTA